MSPSVFDVLVAVSGENCIKAFRFHSETARLDYMHSVSADSRPGPLALSQDRRFVYAGLRGSDCIETFTLSQQGQDGPALTFQARTDLDADPCYLAVDQTGRWLLSAYYGAGQITVHAIGDDGCPSPTPVQRLVTAPKAHCIQSHGKNHLVLVPHVGRENSVHQFLLDVATGELRRIGVEKGLCDAQVGPVGPRHYVFHEPSHSVYFSDEHGSSVTHYRYGDRGLRQRIASHSTLPYPYARANTCAQIHVAPGGRFLYVSNRGHNSLAIFAIDQRSGELMPVGWQETEPMPRAFALLPDGSHLLCSGLASGCISVYALDQDSGHLNFRSRVLVGVSPMWILPLPSNDR